MVSKGEMSHMWLEHPTRSRRVEGSNPIWRSDFFRVSNDAKNVLCYFYNILL